MAEYSLIGKRVPRIDSKPKALGKAEFTADLNLPGMLYGKILRSPHPHARIVSIDTSKAERLPGVRAVVTGKGDNKIGYVWGVFPYTRDQQFLPVEKVRYIGEEVAGVAAINEDIASEAVKLINVEYELLPPVFNPEEAMKEGAPLLHDDKPGNIIVRVFVNEGDVEAAFKKCALILEDRFVSSDLGYCHLEPYAVLAKFDSAGVDIWMPNAGPHMQARPLSTALGIPTSDVRIHKVFIGGAFGGRSELCPAAFIACLLSRKSGRPVKIVFSREENFNSYRQKNSENAHCKMGFKEDGTIMAIDMKCIYDGGAYASASPIATSVPYMNPETTYRFSNYRYDGMRIYTNKTPRGMHPQQGMTAFPCLEALIDQAAEKLGMDAMEIRLKNAAEAGYVTPTGNKILSCALTECIQKATDSMQWKAKRGKLPRGRGIGMGCTSVLSGFPMGIRGTSSAFIKMNEDGDATVISGIVDNGQGNDSMIVQIVAETLGISMDRVKLVSADTGITPIDEGAYSQSATILSGGAAREAALDVKRQLFEVAAKPLGVVNVADLESKGDVIYDKRNPNKNITIDRVVRTALANDINIMGKGERWPITDRSREWAKNPHGQQATTWSYAAGVAEVEVDLETGQVKIVNWAIAHDCGYPINLAALEGQIQRSAMAGGVQAALLERFIWDNGQNLNANFLDYWFPTSVDVPRLNDTIIVTSNDPFGPFGAKEASMSAGSTIHSAVSNAIHDAIGVWIKELPFTPDKVLKALEGKQGKK